MTAYCKELETLPCYWDAGHIKGEVSDVMVIAVINTGIPLTKNLVYDDYQEPYGCVWKHILDMAERDLVNMLIRLPHTNPETN